jgi:imidazole glycerol phosphate synthase glutamine amidotransferase subunit
LPVVVVRTGTANIASIVAGLERAGAAPRVTEDAAEVAAAERLVLPGVGTFGAAMERVAAHGLGEPLRARLAAGRPTLCICVGLQLLAVASDESPGARGLAVVPGTVRRFAGAGLRVPQLGWNRVTADPGCRLLAGGHAYFANSYRLDEAPDGWLVARAEHGGPFVAGLERGAVLACQFHPELSGPFGLGVLRRWLSAGGLAEPVAPARAAEGGGTLGVRIIPCLDVRDGRVVKGVQFQGLRDAGSPPERAAAYEALGADELVILDVSATPEGRATAVETVRAVRAVLSLPLTVGGGVRQADHAAALLEAGADKVSVNTAAVERPALLTELSERFGRQCTVLALDAARRTDGAPGWEVVTRSGRHRTGLDAVDWARDACARGAGEILLTSWDRDGTRAGYDTELLAAVSGAVTVPVIASGGADSAQHMLDAVRAGADAVLAASIFHYDDHSIAALKQSLRDNGVEVRL